MTEVKRPRSVTVVAWIWIVQGALSVISSVYSLFDLVLMKSSNLVLANTERVLSTVVFSSVGFTLSILIIVAGIQLLKMKEWARVFLKFITWLYFLFPIGFAVIMFFLHIATGLNGSKSSLLLGAIIPLLLITLFIVIGRLMLRPLRSNAEKSRTNESFPEKTKSLNIRAMVVVAILDYLAIKAPFIFCFLSTMAFIPGKSYLPSDIDAESLAIGLFALLVFLTSCVWCRNTKEVIIGAVTAIIFGKFLAPAWIVGYLAVMGISLLLSFPVILYTSKLVLCIRYYMPRKKTKNNSD